MVFSSITFLLLFCPIFFGLYYLADKKYKNYLALAASVIFYLWGNVSFFPILLASILLDYLLSSLFLKVDSPVWKRILVTLGILSNVFILLYFKYFNFFIENYISMATLIGLPVRDFPKVMLPIGISFFVFHKISYLIDLYRLKQSPLKNPFDYMLYILLFPQLIAGPIIRFKEISDQIIDRKESLGWFSSGVFLFMTGLAKKVIFANHLGQLVDSQIAQLQTLSSLDLIIVFLAYSFQIYMDFSGYSDMACGLGKMMGFTFPQNFNFPYIAQNITEFWRRWHITLSNWMRDYLYIPLGGNRHGAFRTYLNLILVFFFSGLWHGASWNFIIWGMYHGFFLVLDRLFLLRLTQKIPTFINVLVSFVIVTIGWVFFRLEDFSQTVYVFKKIFSGEFYFNKVLLEPYLMLLLSYVAIYSFLGPFIKSKFDFPWIKKPIYYLLCSGILFLICLGTLSLSGYNPFIYFRF